MCSGGSLASSLLFMALYSGWDLKASGDRSVNNYAHSNPGRTSITQQQSVTGGSPTTDAITACKTMHLTNSEPAQQSSPAAADGGRLYSNRDYQLQSGPYSPQFMEPPSFQLPADHYHTTNKTRMMAERIAPYGQTTIPSDAIPNK